MSPCSRASPNTASHWSVVVSVCVTAASSGSYPQVTPRPAPGQEPADHHGRPKPRPARGQAGASGRSGSGVSPGRRWMPARETCPTRRSAPSPSRTPAAARGRARRPRRPAGGRSAPRSTSAGTSSRSGSLRAGMITSVSPARWAASSFCFTPPIGSTRPVSVTSPVMPTSDRTGRPVSQRRQRGHHRDARATGRPWAPRPPARAGGSGARRARSGRCRAARRASAGRTARSAPTPSSRRRAGRSGSARLAVGIAVASMNSTSPPAPVTASPVATPGTAVRSADSGVNRGRPR